jgi:hypothetical protein
MSDLSPEKFIASMNLLSRDDGVNQGGSRQSRIERRRDTSRIHITTFHLEERLKFYNTLVNALFQLGIENPGTDRHGQYLGIDGSIFSAQARMPPVRFEIFVNPACFVASVWPSGCVTEVMAA